MKKIILELPNTIYDKLHALYTDSKQQNALPESADFEGFLVNMLSISSAVPSTLSPEMGEMVSDFLKKINNSFGDFNLEKISKAFTKGKEKEASSDDLENEELDS